MTTSSPKQKEKKERYVEAIGRRKTAIARVRISQKKSSGDDAVVVIVNGEEIRKYFPLRKHQAIAQSPFQAVSAKDYAAEVKVFGGGIHAQAEAIRLGFARALVTLNPLWRPQLKSLGYLKRDPRMVERKKYGKRKARRPQQWRKR